MTVANTDAPLLELRGVRAAYGRIEVVHGIDLTDALGRDRMATEGAVTVTAAILDELLARFDPA